MTIPLYQYSLNEALKLIEHKDCSAVELINSYYDRIEQREAEVGAWQYLRSRQEYLQHYADNRTFFEQSLLKGLPVGIKDIIDTEGMPTEMGSPIHQGRMPVNDASCVTLLKKAGAVVTGKTVTTEFAYFKPGKTKNPQDLERTPGGSSSGSAAAVADAMVPVALGSQTAASVIRPAAFCGTVGYVGTRGEYSLRGIQPLAQSLDSLGIFSRTVDDIKLLRDILLAQVPTTLSSPEKSYRVLLCQGSSIGATSSDMKAALQKLSGLIADAGAELVELHSCDLLHRVVKNHHEILAWEAYRNLNFEAGEKGRMSKPLQEMMLLGKSMARSEYLAALDQVAQMGRWIWSHPDHREVDFILAPAAPGAAPSGHDSTGQPHMSRPWQAMGLPTITLPGIRDSEGMPLGLQLIGRPRADDQLLAAAKWVEGLLG